MKQISDVNEVWKWAATTLAGIMLGGLGMSMTLGTRFDAHERLAGHPVLEARVDAIEDDLAEIRRLLEAISSKIDKIHPQGGGDG